MIKPRFWFSLILIFIFMSIILSLSGESAIVSNNKSEYLVSIIWPAVNKICLFIGFSKPSWILLDRIIRKLAHIFNYIILYLICFNTCSIIISKYKKVIFIAWYISTLFSILDEFYQTFIPGRSGQIKDICFDNIGIIIGIIITLTIRYYKYKVKS